MKNRMLGWMLIALLFLVSLDVSLVGGYHPFSFRSVHLFVLGMFALFCAWSWERSWIEFFRHHRIWVILSGCWLFIVSLSTIFSISPIQSLWATPFRPDGLLPAIAMVMAFWITLDLCAEVEFRRDLLVAIVSIGVVLSVVGIGQVFGVNITGFESPDAGVPSTLGHPTFFASTLVWTIFITLGLVAFLPPEYHAKDRIRRSTFLMTVPLVIQLIALALTLTRGAWIAVMVGFFLVWALIGVLARAFQKRWIVISFAILGLGMIGIFFFPTSLNNTKSMLDWETGTGRLRVLWWEHAIDAISERPWFGYGSQTSILPLTMRNEPEEWWWGEVDTKTTLSHNTVLDETLAIGLLGSGSLVLIIFFVIHFGLSDVRLAIRKSNFLNGWGAGLFLIGLAAYLVNGLFIFPTLVDRLLLWVVLALLVSMRSERVLQKNKKLAGRFALMNVQRVIAVVLVVFISIFSVDLMILNKKFRNFESDIRSDQPFVGFALERFEEGIRPWNWFGYWEAEFYEELLDTLFILHDQDQLGASYSRERISSFSQRLVRQGQRRFFQHPFLRLFEFRARALSETVSMNEMNTQYQNFKNEYPTWALLEETVGYALKDANQGNEALKHFDKALALYPEPPVDLEPEILSSVLKQLLKKRRAIYQAMGKIALTQQDKAKADVFLEQVIRLDQKIANLNRVDPEIPWQNQADVQ